MVNKEELIEKMIKPININSWYITSRMTNPKNRTIYEKSAKIVSKTNYIFQMLSRI